MTAKIPDLIASTRNALTSLFLSSRFARLAITSSILFVIVVVISTIFEERRIRQKGRQGGATTILGDASYFRRRLGRTELNRDGLGLLLRGYENFTKRGKTWALWGPNDELITVVPPVVMEEIKMLPPTKLNFVQAIEDTFKWSLHTNMLNRVHVDTIKFKLNNKLKELHDFLIEQRDLSMDKALAATQDNQWHTYHAFQLFWDILHPLDTSAIMGADFAANATYIHHMKAYCKTIPALSYFYFVMPAILRRPFWWLSPFGLLTRYHIRALKAALIPEVRARVQAAREGRGYREQFVLIDALVDMKMEKNVLSRSPPTDAAAAASEAAQINLCAEELMFMTFEGVGPVTLLTVQLVFELIAHPDLLAPLRAEVATALEASGGKWTEQALASMPKLESFTRETLRLNGPAPFSVTRKVMSPIPLKTLPLTLHPGQMITSPSHGIHTDPAHYPSSPTRFNGLRFYDPSTNTTPIRATTSSPTFLPFGLGSQACPGRFVGVKMAQLVFARVLGELDMEFWPARAGKPENTVMPGQVMPNLYAKIRVRRRSETMSE